MSHYTVMILSADPSEEALTAALAPFDENLEVEPYKDYEKGAPGEYWAVSSLREKGRLTDADVTWQQVRDAYLAEYPGSDDAPIPDPDDPLRAFTWSTYNPQSKWDWWQIGGRWENRLSRLFTPRRQP